MTNDDLHTHLDLARAYADMGLWHDARAEVQLVLEREPGNAMATALWAVIARELGDDPGSGPLGEA